MDCKKWIITAAYSLLHDITRLFLSNELMLYLY